MLDFYNIRTSTINDVINYIKIDEVDKTKLFLEIHKTNLMFKEFVIRLNALI